MLSKYCNIASSLTYALVLHLYLENIMQPLQHKNRINRGLLP